MADHQGRAPQQSGWGERLVATLCGPLAAGAQLALSVPLLPLSCAIEWRTIFHLVTLVAALAALGAGLLAWQHLHEQRSSSPEHAARGQHLAYGGLVANALALALIGARWLSVFSVGACVSTL